VPRNADAAPLPVPPAPGSVPGPVDERAAREGRTPEDEAMLDRVAVRVVAMRMTVPAILALESMKPLSFVGSQAMYFFEPMVRAFFSVPEYERFAALLERRETMEALLVKIEEKDADARGAEREAKARRRAERDAARNRKETT
jgi:hypothetical protein